jgi:hypothetical protein
VIRTLYERQISVVRNTRAIRMTPQMKKPRWMIRQTITVAILTCRSENCSLSIRFRAPRTNADFVESHPTGISRASKVSLRAEVLVHAARHHQPRHPFQIARLLLDGHCQCHAQSARIAEGLAAYSKALRTCRSSSTLAIVADTFGPDTRMNAALPRRRLRIPL